MRVHLTAYNSDENNDEYCVAYGAGSNSDDLVPVHCQVLLGFICQREIGTHALTRPGARARTHTCT